MPEPYAKRPAPAPPPGPHQLTAGASAPKDEPWNALDFVMMREEPFCDIDIKVVRRAVVYAWKITKKPYWSTPAANVTSEERLAQVLPMMIEQTPPDFRVSGEAFVQIAIADPACKICDGDGWVNGINEAYVGDLVYYQANLCSCAYMDPKPWHRWKPSKDE